MARARRRDKAQWQAQRKAERQAEREAGKLAAVGVVLMVFGAAALLTSFFFLGATGRRAAAILPAEGGVMDPIVLTAPRTVLHVRVQQNVHQEGWSYVDGKLLDQQQNVRLEFGGDLWYETGTDSEGPWSERKTEYALHLLVPEPGAYSFAFETEAWKTHAMRHVPAREVAGHIYVVVQPLRGSPVPFRAAGLLALLIGFILHEMATGAVFRWLARMAENKA